MHHLPVLEAELCKRAVREAVCPRCTQRPPHSEHLGPEVPRSCEPTCTIFLNLPTLQEAVEKRLPVLDWADRAIRSVACSSCQASPSAGDFCSEFFARTCPLSRYGREVIDLLQRVHDRHGHVPK